MSYEIDKIKEDISEIITYMEKNYTDFNSEHYLYSYIKYKMKLFNMLFKEPAFSHENEVRVIKTASIESANLEDFARPEEIMPRVYMELNNHVEIEKVILGPRQKNPFHIALSLKQCGVKKVLLSDLPLR